MATTDCSYGNQEFTSSLLAAPAMAILHYWVISILLLYGGTCLNHSVDISLPSQQTPRACSVVLYVCVCVRACVWYGHLVYMNE